MEPRTRPRIRSRKAIAAGRQAAGSIDDAKRMAQRGASRRPPNNLHERPLEQSSASSAPGVTPADDTAGDREGCKLKRTCDTNTPTYTQIRQPTQNTETVYVCMPNAPPPTRHHGPTARSCTMCRAPVARVATMLSRVSKEVARSSHLADVHRLAVMRAELLVLIATRVQGRGAQDILAPVGGREARCNAVAVVRV
jgi:hypothetical protein